MAEAKKDEQQEASLEDIAIEGLAEDAEEFMTDPLAEGDEMESLRVERDDFRDRFMRALADAENARKRGERDRREAEQYGGSKLARDMLPVYDNLNRALEAVTDDQREQAGPLIEGVELTMRELLNVFEKHGIVLVKPAVGDKFDPQVHQAMFEAPVPNTVAGDIIQVMTEGFMLHERLLRPAQVGVSSTPAS
ncbi:nucleotide exchange factor GrpE [Tropicimonas marinistellae]|uniref:nucleotide exchange factor GrpE n=1 Tax=Tropicimonas marinistellae TaxID=1739787 RepID=UPI000834AB00|nr:nucleotide exchange factor GrpE [Tropicimonas marinistellae]